MKKNICKIIRQESLTPDIFDLRLAAPEIAGAARPGQFVNVYCPGADKILPRPVSLCGYDADTGEIRLVYRVAGKGTAELSKLSAGDAVEALGPLGNGFPLDAAEGRRVLLAGGGIGIPPMLETAKALRGRADVTAVLGYRELTAAVGSACLPDNSGAFLFNEFLGAGRTFVSADVLHRPAEAETSACAESPECSGKVSAPGKTDPAEAVLCGAVQGTVLDAIRENALEADVLFACGPKPMLRALKAYAAEHGMECYLSLEERMACGIGACLACVCETAETDAHSQVKNRRVCKDGPVFRAEEVIL